MESKKSGGRGDRMGRYSKISRNHNLQDQDYKGSRQQGDEDGLDFTAVEEWRVHQPDLHISRQQDEKSSHIFENPCTDNEIKWGSSTATRQSWDGRLCLRTEKRKIISGEVDENVKFWEARDQDYHRDIDYNVKPSHIIMLRMLPPNATTVEIRAQLKEQGIHPKEVRLMRNKTSGQSRGFAFVEFNHIQEATRWMETNQGVLQILGQRVSMHYSDPKPRANEDWLCNKCGVQNFKRREKCFKCSTPKTEAELKLLQLPQEVSAELHNNRVQGLLPLPPHYQTPGLSVAHGQSAQVQTDIANDTLILRNLGPHTSVDTILSTLSPFATLSPSNVRLIKDRQTNLNRGFAFLQLSTIVEASQLLQMVQAQLPSLSMDGKTIVMEFAKGSKRDAFSTDGSTMSAATVASTAIAAAQWAVSQTDPNVSSGYLNEVKVQQAAAVTYKQESSSGSDSNTDFTTLSTGTPGDYTTERSHTQQVTGTPVITSTTQVKIEETSVFSQLAIPGTKFELKQYPVPNMSTYQYDESSGYYYDPFTGLYYDSNSQYYYNPHIQQYMYWDGEKHSYIPAGDLLNMTNVGTESKSKKEKNKSKTAQQIAKDMERWAKSLNKVKENMRSSTLVSGQMRGRIEDLKESASADAGYAVLEKKGALLERPQINLEDMRQTTISSPVQQLGLVPAYNGDADSDEEQQSNIEREAKMTDWSKLACLLCQRQFPSKEALIRHQHFSELHRQNMKRKEGMPDKEKLKDGFQPPELRKRRIMSM